MEHRNNQLTLQSQSFNIFFFFFTKAENSRKSCCVFWTGHRFSPDPPTNFELTMPTNNGGMTEGRQRRTFCEKNWVDGPNAMLSTAWKCPRTFFFYNKVTKFKQRSNVMIGLKFGEVGKNEGAR